MIRIIVVEDDPVVAQLNAAYLSRMEDCQVIGTYANGREALACLQRTPVDLAVLDVHMPVCTGLELLRQMGFSMASPTWNLENDLAGSHLTGQRLSARGREFIRNTQKYRMIVDVSHCSDAAFWVFRRKAARISPCAKMRFMSAATAACK